MAAHGRGRPVRVCGSSARLGKGMLSGSRGPAVAEQRTTIATLPGGTSGSTTITGRLFSRSPSSGGQLSHHTINPCVGISRLGERDLSLPAAMAAHSDAGAASQSEAVHFSLSRGRLRASLQPGLQHRQTRQPRATCHGGSATCFRREHKLNACVIRDAFRQRRIQHHFPSIKSTGHYNHSVSSLLMLEYTTNRDGSHGMALACQTTPRALPSFLCRCKCFREHLRLLRGARRRARRTTTVAARPCRNRARAFP